MALVTQGKRNCLLSNMTWVRIPPSVNVFNSIMVAVNECRNSGINGTSDRKRRGKESNGDNDGYNMSDRDKDI